MNVFQVLKTPCLYLFGVLFFATGVTVYAEDSAGKNNSEIKVPFSHGLGKQKFDLMCAKCHGEWATGTDQGPPLMHGFYKPSHHSDRAFYRATFEGTRQHHWNFGDMPPVGGATQKDAEQIIKFLRWMQKSKGIY